MLKSETNLRNSYNANREIAAMMNEENPLNPVFLWDYENYKDDGFKLKDSEMILLEFKQRQDTLIGDYVCRDEWKYEKTVRLFGQRSTYSLICPFGDLERYGFNPFDVVIFDKTFAGYIVLKVETFERLMELRTRVKLAGRDPVSGSNIFFLPLEEFEKVKFRG